MHRHSRASGVVFHVMLAVALGFAVGCASPTAPSSTAGGTRIGAVADPAPARTVQLTVTVLQRGSREPLEGATVTTQGAVGVTDASGQCWFSVSPNVDTEVSVVAAGYLPMSAGGMLGNDERWTFYLARPDASN